MSHDAHCINCTVMYTTCTRKIKDMTKCSLIYECYLVVFKGTHTVCFSISFYNVNPKPMSHRN